MKLPPKKPKRFTPKSKHVRYDKASGLWIQGRKRLFLYWFRFLQYAERHPVHEVDWRKYGGWGGKEVVLNTKFDDWWKDHWKDLFGFAEGENPKFAISTTKPKTDGYRYALMVLENQHRGDNWDIALWLEKKERIPRHSAGGALGQGLQYEEILRGTKYRKNYRGDDVRRKESVGDDVYGKTHRIIGGNSSNTHAINPELNEARTTKRDAMRLIARHKRKGGAIVKNVCKGEFP